MKRQLFLLIVFISLMDCAYAQWQQTSLKNINVGAIAINGSDIYAGSNCSGVFLSSDNGDTWTEKNDGLPTYPAVNAFCITGNDIFAGGTFGVYLSTNNGSSWTAMNNGLTSSGNIQFVDALIMNGNYLLAGTDSRGIYVSSDNGNNWTPTSLISGVIYTLAKYESNIFAGTYQSGVYLSTDNFTNWTSVNTGLSSYPWVMSLAISGNNIFAGTNGTGVFLSSNNGSSWTAKNNGLLYHQVWSLAINGTDIFAGTSEGGVYLSSDNGNTWTAKNNGLPAFSDITALAISGNTLFAGLPSRGVWKRSLSDITVGINEINSTENHIEVYPNPAKDKLTLISPQKADMELLSIQGQKILQQQLFQGKTVIDLTGLAKGIYILKLSNNKKTEVIRIVKE
jgi:photosystem II stability/assembly factor-like uncharacterized protein